jgi:hypothetical protein
VFRLTVTARIQSASGDYQNSDCARRTLEKAYTFSRSVFSVPANHRSEIIVIPVMEILKWSATKLKCANDPTLEARRVH